MAATDDKSSISEGQVWNMWDETIGSKSLDNEEDEETEGEKKRPESDAMKLRKEDMPLFGFCPAWDDFFLVVCELCSHVIKPQALKAHIELRHGSSYLARSERSESSTPHRVSKTGTSHTSTSTRTIHSRSKGGSSHNNNTSVKDSSLTTSRSKTEKAESESKVRKNPSMAPVVRVERMPASLVKEKSASVPGDKKELPSPQQPPPPPPRLLPGPGPGSPHIHNSGLTPFPGQITSVHGSVQQADSVDGSLIRKTSNSKNKKVPKEKKLLPCKDREYDPNIHCGVVIVDTGKPCTRSLTCKTHSLSLRRAVIGRKKNFDELLADHRALKAAHAQIDTKPPVEVNSVPSDNKESHVPTLPCGSTTVPCVNSKSQVSTPKTTLMSGIQKTSSVPVSKSFPNKSESVPFNRPLALGGNKPDSVSCGDLPQPPGEIASDQAKVIPSDAIYVPHHPRPAALCNFGFRTLGNGLFLLDRRWDLPRAAFRAAVCTERSSHPPPLKKLCVESRLPPVPEPQDPSDPYNFSCHEASTASTQPSRPAAVITSALRPPISVSTTRSLPSTVSSKPSPPKSAASPVAQKPLKPKTASPKSGKGKEGTTCRSPPNSGGSSSQTKKKRTNISNGVTVASSQGSKSTVTVPLSFPFALSDQFGAFSRLNTSAPVTPNRSNVTPAIMCNQSSVKCPTGPSSGCTKESGVLVSGVDMLNGRLPVTNALLHSVTVGRPTSGTAALLTASSGGLGITLGTAGLVGQLSQLQQKLSSAMSGERTSNTKSSTLKNTKPTVHSTSHCAQSGKSATWSSAKAKSRKITKTKSSPSDSNHVLGYQSPLLDGASDGNIISSALLRSSTGVTNYTLSQNRPSPVSTPSPVPRSDCGSPVSSPLFNGLGPSLPSAGVTPVIGLTNHTQGVSPPSGTSSPGTDLSSPGSTGSGPKVLLFHC